VTSPEDLPGAPGRDAVTGAPGSVWEPSPAPQPDAGRVVRPARPEDVPEILAMVRELAEYERSAHEVRATEAMLADLLFGTNTPSGTPAAFCHVALAPSRGPDADAPLAGMALWFLNASTWTGQHGIYLEDLFVRPAHRGLGLGQALMAELARICLDRGYTRLEWWVLDWNTPAIDFYRSLGARAMDEWTVHRITGADLHALALRAPAG
jgi:GNAT superfamily N-acetyltransferase